MRFNVASTELTSAKLLLNGGDRSGWILAGESGSPFLVVLGSIVACLNPVARQYKSVIDYESVWRCCLQTSENTVVNGGVEMPRTNMYSAVLNVARRVNMYSRILMLQAVKERRQKAVVSRGYRMGVSREVSWCDCCW